MSNVVLAGLVKTAVAELVNEQKPFNLALVLSRIPAQSTTVVDLDFVETQMNKLFYAEEMADFEISIVDGDIVYAPMMMSNQQISDALSGKPQKTAQRHIYNLVYSPDSRGRIRFPVRLTSTVQKTDSNKVWVVTNGDEIRVSAHKPRSASKPMNGGSFISTADADNCDAAITGPYDLASSLAHLYILPSLRSSRSSDLKPSTLSSWSKMISPGLTSLNSVSRSRTLFMSLVTRILSLLPPISAA